MKTFVELVTEIKKSFDNADDVVRTLIENDVETTSIATASHATGSYLIYNKKLYKVTDDIAVGDTLDPTPTTGNIEESDDIMAMLEALITKNQAISDEIADMNNVLGAKNLLPNNATSQTVGGLTFTKNNDGSLTVNGTATSGFNFNLNSDNDWIKTGLDFIFTTGIPYDVDAANLTIAITETSGGSTVYKHDGDTFKFNSVPYSCVVTLWCPSGQTYNNVTFYPMIRLASITDDTYVPYAKTNQQLTEDTNAIEPMLNILGAKNLLPNNATTQVVNGVTFTVNSDGSITVNGTATESAFIRFVALDTDLSSMLEPNVPYTISCECSDPTVISSASTYYATFEARGVEGSYKYIDTYKGEETNSFTSQELTKVNTYLQISAGFTANNLTFYPMIRPASIKDDTYVSFKSLVKYKEVTITVASTNWNGIIDGVDVPNMVNMICLTTNIHMEYICGAGYNGPRWFARFKTNTDEPVSSGNVTIRIYYL